MRQQHKPRLAPVLRLWDQTMPAHLEVRNRITFSSRSEATMSSGHCQRFFRLSRRPSKHPKNGWLIASYAVILRHDTTRTAHARICGESGGTHRRQGQRAGSVVAAVPLLGVEGEHFAEQVEGLLLGALVHHGHGAVVGQIKRLVRGPRRSHHGGLALGRLTLALALAPQRCRWWLVVLLGEEQLPQRSGGLARPRWSGGC